MMSIDEYLEANRTNDLISYTVQKTACELYNVTMADVERIALKQSLLPARYQRNRMTLSTQQQLQLFNSVVAVIGSGGLGGYIIEELARIGVGTLIVLDPDVFEEHNYNRQLLATDKFFGRPKVEAAVSRVREINPAVNIIGHQIAYCKGNGNHLLSDASLVIDALDSIPTRLELAETCRDLGIPLVHGAIGGWYGQVATQFPEDYTLNKIFRYWESGKGIEQKLGNPSFTPAVIASLQVAEACKVLLGIESVLRNKQLIVNLLDMEMEVVCMD